MALDKISSINIRIKKPLRNIIIIFDLLENILTNNNFR